MSKTYKFEDVQNIRRNYYGVVIEIVYRHRKWSKKLLRERLRLDRDVQKAALRVILEQHSKIKSALERTDDPVLTSTNVRHVKGFHPAQVKLIPTFEFMLSRGGDFDEMEVASLGKFLPKYAEQIWLRILSNLNIKYRAQTFSTPSRSRRK